MRTAAVTLACAALWGCATAGPPSAGEAPRTVRETGADAAAPTTWWKGNLHTHSLWSDGEDYPEMIAAWYRDHGYDFVAFTEHDMLQAGGDRWVDVNAPDDGWPPRNASARKALTGYVARFGDMVDQRVEGERHLVRLRPLSEYRDWFEEPGAFLLLMGEEITDREGAHVNAIEPAQAILPRGGAGPGERIRANLAAVREQEAETGRRILAFVNHPNFVWSLTAEEIADIPDARFFEVFNGHAMVANEGDSVRASTERIWDVALSLRLAAGGPLLYGIAGDDAHDYREHSGDVSRPGRGWVRVRSRTLDAAALAAAMDAGDFYASTGVALRDVRCDAGGLHIDIDADPGASYRVSFIGTRAGTPLDSRPVVTAAGDTLRTTRIYGDGVGAVLAEVERTRASYTFVGDELYVRARIDSSLPHVDPTTGNVLGTQRAWTQPVRPAAAAAGGCGGGTEGSPVKRD
ncbi:MAG TPA: hypothetical protein VK936_09530 [Longimicrobiales bacterium]|nr:hypothetical protein [Longimicrobiales bacterium]